jgi:large subunit ribosomal protein L21
MFAVIRTGGKQYKVQKDDKIEVEKLEGDEGASVALDEVLFIGGDKAVVGSPLVKGASVTATIVAQKKAPKVTIFKKKRRQNYRRKRGHRQPLTVLQILDIKAAA